MFEYSSGSSVIDAEAPSNGEGELESLPTSGKARHTTALRHTGRTSYGALHLGLSSFAGTELLHLLSCRRWASREMR